MPIIILPRAFRRTCTFKPEILVAHTSVFAHVPAMGTTVVSKHKGRGEGTRKRRERKVTMNDDERMRSSQTRNRVNQPLSEMILRYWLT